MNALIDQKSPILSISVLLGRGGKHTDTRYKDVTNYRLIWHRD